MKKWIAYGVVIAAMLTTVILCSKQNTRRLTVDGDGVKNHVIVFCLTCKYK